MLLDPANWLGKLMEITYMSLNFKILLLALALVGFATSWTSERQIFPPLARFLGSVRTKLQPGRQKTKKKEYKRLLIDMQI